MLGQAVSCLLSSSYGHCVAAPASLAVSFGLCFLLGLGLLLYSPTWSLVLLFGVLFNPFNWREYFRGQILSLVGGSVGQRMRFWSQSRFHSCGGTPQCGWDLNWPLWASRGQCVEDTSETAPCLAWPEHSVFISFPIPRPPAPVPDLPMCASSEGGLTSIPDE